MAQSSPLARRTDPQTSHDAALRAVKGLVKSQEARILRVLKAMPDGGTGKEIAEAMTNWALHFSNVQVMRRMRALLDKGLVRRRPNADDSAWRSRDGQVIHYYVPSDMPLFQ